jgi:uncharacterized DUF497 family protein
MFDRSEFEGDEHNAGHIARHGVEPWEAEETILDTGRVGATAYRVRGEVRWAIVGATEAGRVLLVLTERAGRSRVVTARDAEVKEKRRYRRR